VTLSTVGQWKVCSQARDNAGSWGAITCSANYAYKIDKTAPPAPTHSPTAQAWTNQNVTVSFSATDTGGSGTASYQYCTTSNGTTCTPSTAGGSVVLSATGQHTVCSRAIDTAGTTGATTCSAANAYKIDKTAPPAPTHSPTLRAWGNTNVTVTFSSTDTGGSGTASYQYCTTSNGTTCTPSTAGGSVVLSATGQHTVCSRAIDTAGTTGATTCSALNAYKIDKTSPSGSLSFPTNNTWYKASTWGTITGTASDTGGAGVHYTELLICRNPSSWQHWTGSSWASGCSWGQGITKTGTSWTDSSVTSAQLTDAMEHRVYTRVYDNAGNFTNIANPVTFYYDNTPPVVSANNSSSSWFSSRSTTVSALDSATSVTSVRYKWNSALNASCTDGTATSHNATLTVPAGSNRLYICAVDTLGNIEAWDSGANMYRVDTTNPTVSFGTNGNTTYLKSHSTTVTVADTQSGVSTRHYQWTTSTTAPTSGSFSTTFTNGANLTTPAGVTGVRYLWIKARDAVGNELITRSNVFHLDNTAPTGSITRSSVSPTNNATVTFALSATDTGGATVSQMQFSCDNTNFTTLEAYATAKNLNVTNFHPNCTTTNGIKTIYVKYTDTAGNVSPSYSATVVYDTVAPSASISYTNDWTNTPSVTVTTTESDATSGVASCVLQRSEATITNGTVGTFGAYASVQTNCNNYTFTATRGKAYKFRYTVTDNVGLSTTDTSASVVKIRSLPQSVSVNGSTSATTNLGTYYSEYQTETFTTVHRDNDGYQDIGYVHLNIAELAGTVAENSFFGRYNQTANIFEMYNGSTYLNAGSPGSMTEVCDNYVCLSPGSTVSGTGSDLTVTWKIRFRGNFSGLKHLYVRTEDKQLNVADWQDKGDLTLVNGIEIYNTSVSNASPIPGQTISFSGTVRYAGGGPNVATENYWCGMWPNAGASCVYNGVSCVIAVKSGSNISATYTIPNPSPVGFDYGFRFFCDGPDANTAANNGDWDQSAGIAMATANNVPTQVSATLSSPSVVTDGFTQYTLTTKASDINGVSDISQQQLSINTNTGNGLAGRGVLGFSPDLALWNGSNKNPMACTGGGFASQYITNSEYLDLVSCSTTTSGNERTVNYVVRFNTNYGDIQNNDLAGYVIDYGSLNSGWVSYDTNFNILPAPPASLAVTPTHNGVMNISWVDNSDATTGFSIERKTGALGTFAEIVELPVIDTSYVDTVALSSQEYYYRIRAISSAGYSAYSGETLAVSYAYLPTVPTVSLVSDTATNLLFTVGTGGNLANIAFETKVEYNGLTRYLELSGGNLVLSTSANTHWNIASDLTSKRITELLPNTDYTVSVRARNALQQPTLWSSSVMRTTRPANATVTGTMSTTVSAVTNDLTQTTTQSGAVLQNHWYPQNTEVTFSETFGAGIRNKSYFQITQTSSAPSTAELQAFTTEYLGQDITEEFTGVWNGGDMKFIPATEGAWYIHILPVNTNDDPAVSVTTYGPFLFDYTLPSFDGADLVTNIMMLNDTDMKMYLSPLLDTESGIVDTSTSSLNTSASIAYDTVEAGQKPNAYLAYRIYIDESDDGVVNRIINVSKDDAEPEITGLNPALYHNFTIGIFDKAGNETQVSFPIFYPVGRDAVVVSENSIFWQWKKGLFSNEGYRMLDASITNNPATNPIDERDMFGIGANAENYLEVGLTPNTQYQRLLKEKFGSVWFEMELPMIAVTLPSSADVISSNSKEPEIWYNDDEFIFSSSRLNASHIEEYRFVWSSSSQESIANCTEGTAWSAGTLSLTAQSGNNYLHVLACNSAGEPASQGKVLYGPFRYDGGVPVITHMVLDSGNEYTAQTSVMIQVSAVDLGGSGLISMNITGDIVSEYTGVFMPVQSVTLTPVDGVKTITVTVTDGSSNVSVPVSKTITLDGSAVTMNPIVAKYSTTSLETQITDNWWSDNQPYFSWGASTGPSGISGYSLAVNSEPNDTVDTTAEEYVYSMTSLSEGTHTLKVKAQNNAGTWSTAETFVYKVDTIAPTLAVAFPANNEVYGTSSWQTLSGTSSDSSSGIQSVQISLQNSALKYFNGTEFVDGEQWIPVTGTTSWSYALALGDLADGNYTLKVKASDNSRKEGGLSNTTEITRTFTIDKVAPTIPTISPADASVIQLNTRPEITVEPYATVHICLLSATADGGACESYVSHTTGSTGIYTFTESVPLASSSQVKVFAEDSAGNQSPTLTVNYTYRATLQSLSSTTGKVGDTLTFTGVGFGTTANEVYFTGVTASGADIVSWSDTQVRVTIPAGALSGSVYVLPSHVSQSNSLTFSIVKDPVTVEVSPTGNYSLAVGESKVFVATAKDEDGNTVTGVSFTWSVTHGVLSGTGNSVKTFSASSAGNAVITAEITGGISGTSGLITVYDQVSSSDIACQNSGYIKTDFRSIGSGTPVGIDDAETTSLYTNIKTYGTGESAIKINNYTSAGVVQSEDLYSGSIPLQSVILMKNDTTENDAQISYEVTFNGTDWHTVTPGVVFNAPSAGTVMKWRATLSGTTSPTLYWVYLKMSTQENTTLSAQAFTDGIIYAAENCTSGSRYQLGGTKTLESGRKSAVVHGNYQARGSSESYGDPGSIGIYHNETDAALIKKYLGQ
jgi:hypothetical protein